MAQKFKVEKKFVVTKGWSDEIKTFSNEHDAKEYAMLLNDTYQSGIDYAVENPAKVAAGKVSDY